jgi:hypothetical protein
MASLFNTKISNTYVGLIKMSDNLVLSSSLREISDGSGNGSGIHINNAGDLKVTNILEFGSLKDTGENITISKFVDEADGISNNDNDTSIPTSAAVVDYVAARITLEDLDFRGDDASVLGSIDLDSQTFAIVGTSNEIETSTSAGSQQLQIGLPDNVTIGGNLQVNGLLKGNNNIVIKDTSDRTMAAFYGGGKAELYFNNSKKFETTSDGATVTGGLTATGGSVFTGATFSSDVDFADSAKARFGAGNDLRIYHDGTDSLIRNYTGNLYIANKSDDKDIFFQSDDGSGGDATYFQLDGTNVRTLVSKNVNLKDNVLLQIGDSQDLRLYHNSTHSYISQAGVGTLYIQTEVDDGDIVFVSDDGTGGVAEYFRVDGAFQRSIFTKHSWHLDSVSAYFGSSSDLKINHDSSNSNIVNETGNILIEQKANDGDIIFYSDDGSGNVAQYFRVDGGEVLTQFSKKTRHIDNVQATFGTGEDLLIYHNGTNSFIQDIGTGNLYIDATSSVIFRDYGSAEEMAKFINDGAVELYYDNAKKFETTSTGVQIHSNINMNDNGHLYFGASNDLDIYHDGSHSYIKANGTGDLYVQNDTDDVVIQGADDVFIYTQGGEDAIIARGDGSVSLFYDAVKKLETKNGGVDILGTLDATGNISVSNASPTLTLTDTDNSNDITFNSVGGALVLNSTSDQVFQIGGVEKFRVGSTTATFAGSLTIAQDLTVNGTTTTVNTETLAVEDPLISMAKDNSANSVDIGFYGRYNDGSNRYLGLFSDASDSNTFNLFKGTTTEPTTTVDKTATGFDYANLILGNAYISQYLYHFGDANTYLEFAGADNIKLVAGGKQFLHAHDNGSLYLSSNNSTALTLDTSQNATFAGDISLADSKYLYLGTSNDLQLYHDGTDSYISNTQNEGHLIIQNGANDKDVVFKCDNGDGGLETYFYLDGSSAEAGAGAARYTIFPTDSYLTFGDNKYLEMFWSTNGVIRNHSGDLFIDNYADNSDIKFRSDDGTGSQTEYFRVDGGSEKVIASKNFAFTDNVKAEFGDSGDLQIFHDGSNSYITEGGTGVLAIQTNGTEIQLNSTGGEYLARFIPDSTVKLYYDNVQRFQTTSTGIEVSGTASTFAGSVSISHSSGDSLTLTKGTTEPSLRFEGDTDKDFCLTISGETFTVTQNDGATDILTLDHDTKNATFGGGIGIGGATVANSYGIEITATSGNIIRSTRGTSVFAAYQSNNSDVYLGTTSANTFKIITNDATAVTIGSDKNAEFAGTITVNGNATNLIDGIQTNTSNTAVSAKTGTLRLNYAGGSAAGDYGASLLFTQRWHSGTASDIVMGQIAGVKVEGDGNFGGGLAFFTGNNTGNDLVERMRIDNDGFVGIGATVPEKMVHIKGATGDATPQVLVQNSSTGDASIMYNVSGQSYIMGIDYDDSKKFKIAGSGALGTTDLITVLSSGALGVGTINPAEKVEINGSMKLGNMKFQNATGGRIGFNRNTADGAIYDNSYSAFQINGATASIDYLDFQAYSSAGAYAGGFVLTGTGKIGVNNNSPGVRFEIGKNDSEVEVLGVRYSTVPAYISSSFDGTYALSTFSTNQYNTSDGSGGWSSMSNASYGTASVQIATNTAGGELRFFTAPGANQDPTERLRINKDGHLLFNLQDYSTEPTNKNFFIADAGSGASVTIGGHSGTHTAVLFRHNGATTPGSISITTNSTAYNTSSDYRLKEDLQDFNGLEKVSNIKVYDFKWKADESRSYGVMAHELEEVLPQAVVGEKDAEEMQSVDYSKIVPLLVKSIQELQEEVNELKQQCNCK